MPGPHVQIKMYVPEYTYSVDFYWDLGPSNMGSYLNEFSRCLKKVETELAGKANLRTTPPFYFLRCPGCRSQILTNRDPGSSLSCQRCSHSFEVEPFAEDPLARALMLKIWGQLGVSDPGAWKHLFGPDLK